MPNPDYVLTSVWYESRNSRIIQVQRREYDVGANFMRNTEKVMRSEIVSSLESGFQYRTAPPDGEGGIQWGDEVELVDVGGETFIRTDGEAVKEDDLGDLPEY